MPRVLSTVLLFVGLACVARANEREKIAPLVEPLIEAETLVGCVVGVVHDGEREVYSFGAIRPGDDASPDGKTIYEIGSITKALTGTLLADMAERGEIEVDAPLQQFMPKNVTVAVNEEPIKLLHLATHTSGLPRLPDNMKPADPQNPYADYTRAKMFDFLKNHKPRRAPGKYEYSNYAMGLLGEILAVRAETSYEQLLKSRITEPLGLADTVITLSEEQRSRLAPPHDAQGDREHNWDFEAFAGAGAVRSTADDMTRFMEATLDEEETPFTKAIQTAWKHHHGGPGEIGVGLGWHIARDGVTRWHNGQTAGYSSAMFIFPPKKLGVVVLANTATDATTSLAEKITQALLGMEPEPVAVRKAIEVDRETLKKYAGKYALSPFFVITVTEEEGKLMAQATGQEKFQIFPTREKEFFYKVVDAQITFVEDEKNPGKIASLILHQNGLDQPAVRFE